MIEESPLPWPEVIETLYRRRWLILAPLLLGLGLPTAHALLMPAVYKVTAKILLSAQPTSGARAAAMSETQIKSELALLRSPALIRSVLESEPYATATDDTQAESWFRLGWGMSGQDARQESQGKQLNQRIRALAERMEATPLANSNLIQVSLRHPQPEWAARFVNDLLSHHVTRIAELNEQNNAKRFFQRQKDLLGQQLQQAIAALSAYREQHGAELLSGDQKQLATLLASLEATRVSAETERLELEASIAFLTTELGRQPETIASESRITESEDVKFLNSRILQLEVKRSDLLSRFTPTSAMVREVDRQLEEGRQLLANKEKDTLAEVTHAINPAHQTLQVELVQAQSRNTAVAARLGALNAQIAQYRQALSELERIAPELQRLESDVAAQQEAYDNYVRREEAARLSSALDESGIVNLTVVEKADVPPRPEPSESAKAIPLFAALGLALGLVLAAITEWLDPKVKSSIQARRLSQLPVLAELPRL